MGPATNEPVEMFEQHRPALLLWAKMRTPDWIRAKFDPADLVQQTLLEALRDRDKLKDREAQGVLAYLRRALTNNLTDAFRKYKRNQCDVSIEAFDASSHRLCNILEGAHSSPSERAARNERFERLAEGLSRLPDDQRIAVEMKYLQGAKVSEIARLLGRSEGAVSALLFRGIAALRDDRQILET